MNISTQDIYTTHGDLLIPAQQPVTVYPCSDPGFVIVESAEAMGYEIKVPASFVAVMQ